MDNPFQSLHVLVVHPRARIRDRIAKLLRKQGVADIIEAEDGQEVASEIARHGHAMEIAIFDPMQTDATGVGLIDLVAKTGKVRTAALLMDDDLAASDLEEVLTDRRIGFLGILKGRFGAKELNNCLLEYIRHSQSSAGRQTVEVQGSERSADEILTALTERQFTAFLQPEIDVHTRQFSGFEALARWRHPIHGLIPPFEFIPPMERSGHIEALTDIVFQRSLQVLAKWREQGHKLNLSVNFSPLSLANAHTAERLLRQIDRMRIPPECIAVEISEAAVDSPVIIETLRNIRSSGLRVTLDNYNSDNLSVAACEQIGCSGIKLQRALISDIHENAENHQKVAEIAAELQAAQIDLHAEGIEQAAEWYALEELGCIGLQGFMLGKPMDASQLNGWYNLYQDRIPPDRA